MLLLLVSFIGGVLTVLAPCILPLLPVIVGGSLSDGSVNRRKALTVILSLGASVILFTLLLKTSSLFIMIPESTWKIVSGGIIILLGIIFLFPAVWENGLMARFSASSNKLLGAGAMKKSFWGDVIVGAALGPVFSTCSPTYFVVIATVLPASPLIGFIYLLTYTAGLCLALLMISLIGQRIVSKFEGVADSRSWFKKVLGILFIIVGLAILSGLDKRSQTFLLDAGLFDITRVEEKLLNIVPPQGTVTPLATTTQVDTVIQGEKPIFLNPAEKKFKYPLAPDLSTIDYFINTDGKPLTLAELRGKKVVLLDIWTYSCINCQRTLPYLNDWYKKYKDEGLEIIGLHTPEFAFEKLLPNVEKAVKNFGIEYPVAMDNDFSTWNAYGNQYWPRKYLIDIDGYIIYDHAGEGDYAGTERLIQRALLERKERLNMATPITTEISAPTNAVSVTPGGVGSPEIYFGSLRNEHLANGEVGVSKEADLVIPQTIEPNSLYLGGRWSIMPEYAESKDQGEIVFWYKAKNVYIVASSLAGTQIDVYQDKKLVKTLNIKDETLYHLIEDTSYGEHTLEIKLKGAGLRAFTFTFG